MWVCLGSCGKLFRKCGHVHWGGSHDAVLCCLGHFRVWLLVFHFGWIQEPYQGRRAIRNHNTLTMLNWVCLGQTPQYRNSKLALMMWLRSLWQNRKHLQCPAVVQGFSERSALFGLRLWDCLGHRTDCQAMKTHHAEERRTWKLHAICFFVRSTHTHPKLDGCVVWVVIFYWVWPGYYTQQETKYPKLNHWALPPCALHHQWLIMQRRYIKPGDLFIGNARNSTHTHTKTCHGEGIPIPIPTKCNSVNHVVGFLLAQYLN